MTMTTAASSETLAPLSSAELQGKSTALATSVPSPAASFDQYRFALEPASFNDAFKLAAIVAKAQMYGCTTPEGALIRLLTGRSLGLPATVALQHVYDVKGRPSLSAKLKMTLTMRHPECEKFEHVESDEKHATYVIKRKGQPEKRFTYTFEQAKIAGVVKPDSAWMTVPIRMNEARASSHASDVVFPDACMGLPTLEEVLDMGPAESTPSQTAKPVVSQGEPARDFDAEALALKAKITAAETKEAKRAVHAEVATFCQEAGEPYASDAKTCWNLIHGPAKKNGDAPASADPPFGSASQGKLV
jgi:hypothetical protein